jgi:hypothetical protein
MLASAINADFRGRENNQSFRGWKPRFFGDLAVTARQLLIIFQAENDLIGIVSTLSDP